MDILHTAQRARSSCMKSSTGSTFRAVLKGAPEWSRFVLMRCNRPTHYDEEVDSHESAVQQLRVDAIG
eukprot:6363148-Amphidinium_carterae.1